MNFKFSKRISGVKASAIREILKMMNDPEIISFGGGNPASETFPITKLKEISDDIFSNQANTILEYGITEGDIDFKKAALKFLSRHETVLKDYIIKEKNLKEALANIMPSYWTIYECDNFTLRDGFNLGHNHTEDIMNLLIDCREHPLGSIIKITINYQGRKDVFEVPLLKDPTLSYNKLESKIIERVYKFLTQPGYN